MTNIVKKDYLMAKVLKIKENIPKRFFFEKDFLNSGKIKNILSDLDLTDTNTRENNILNCSPILTRQQEYHLFRKYNYLRYKITKSTIGIPKSRKKYPKYSKPVCLEKLGEKSIFKIENYIEEMNKVRNIILKSNMRLIFVNVNKMFPGDTFENQEYFTNGYSHLLKAIDCFDHTRGFKFSTYATWVLKRNLARDRNINYKNSSKFEALEENELIDKKEVNYNDINEIYNREFIKKVMEKLKNSTMVNPSVKVKILSECYGVNGCEKKTLEQIGKELNLSKERIRQIKTNIIDYLSSNIVYDPLC